MSTASPAASASAAARRGADAHDDGVAVDRAPVVRADTLDGTVALERGDAGFQEELDAVLAVEVAVDRADLEPEHALERHRLRRDDGHVHAALTSRGGDLGPDPAGADDDEPAAGLQTRPQRVAVGERAQEVHAVELRAGDAQRPRLRAGGQQQPVVGEPLAAVELELAARGVEAGRRHAGAQFDVVLGVEARRMDGGRLAVRLAAQVVLRERRALVGPLRLGAQQYEAAVEALLAQGLGGLGAGEAGPDDGERRVWGHDLLASSGACVYPPIEA